MDILAGETTVKYFVSLAKKKGLILKRRSKFSFTLAKTLFRKNFVVQKTELAVINNVIIWEKEKKAEILLDASIPRNIAVI